MTLDEVFSVHVFCLAVRTIGPLSRLHMQKMFSTFFRSFDSASEVEQFGFGQNLGFSAQAEKTVVVVEPALDEKTKTQN